MTAHLHETYVEGCYRCDIGRDEEEVDWMADPTLLLDGQRCVDCAGTLIAEPVIIYEPAIVRCRDCGALA
jgi:hypothetical protein